MSTMADSDGNPAIWEWHDNAVEEPGSGVRSPIRLASHWLCALNELVIFLNLGLLTCENGDNTRPAPWWLQGCREMSDTCKALDPSRASGRSGRCMAQSTVDTPYAWSGASVPWG